MCFYEKAPGVSFRETTRPKAERALQVSGVNEDCTLLGTSITVPTLLINQWGLYLLIAAWSTGPVRWHLTGTWCAKERSNLLYRATGTKLAPLWRSWSGSKQEFNKHPEGYNSTSCRSSLRLAKKRLAALYLEDHCEAQEDGKEEDHSLDLRI